MFTHSFILWGNLEFHPVENVFVMGTREHGGNPQGQSENMRDIVLTVTQAQNRKPVSRYCYLQYSCRDNFFYPSTPTHSFCMPVSSCDSIYPQSMFKLFETFASVFTCSVFYTDHVIYVYLSRHFKAVLTWGEN